MATQVFRKSVLQLQAAAGTTPSGQPKYRTSSVNGIAGNATADSLSAIGSALGALIEPEVVSLIRHDTSVIE